MYSYKTIDGFMATKLTPGIRASLIFKLARYSLVASI